jgi:hypothetical protein
MSGIALVRHVSAPLAAREHARPDARPLETEHVEEVWDAELVGELAAPGWLAVPALSTYARAGHATRLSRIDVRA